MISFLIIGIAFAIGHHAFYRSLQNTEVRSAPYQFAGWQITPQQLNTAGGTAFAFAVKASLVLAISTAYVQLFFRAITKVSHSMACIDSWFSGLGDITALFGLTTFWTHPVLATIAMTTWLLPIAAIVAPATLSVSFDHLPPVEESHFVPVPAFASLKFADPYSQGGYKSSFEVTRTVQATAAAGSILPIPAPAVNASWVATMPAPRLACDNVDDTILNAIKDNLAVMLAPFVRSTYDPTDPDYSGDGWEATVFAENMLNYMSWSATSNKDIRAYSEMPPLDIYDPAEFAAVGRPTASQFAAIALQIGFDRPINIFQDLLYVASLPRLVDTWQNVPDAFYAFIKGWNASTADGARKAMDWAFEEASVVRCKLVPSEYTLSFSYDGPAQEQKIEILHVIDVEMDLHRQWPMVATGTADPGCLYLVDRDSIVAAEGKNPSECQIDDEILLRQSYRAMMDSFAKLTVGAMNPKGVEEGTAILASPSSMLPNRSDSTFGHYQYKTQVLGTSLADSIELKLLDQTVVGAEDLIEAYTAYDAPNLNGREYATVLDEAYSLLRPASQTAPRKHLKDMIEELFFNVSISMASSTMFRYNITAPNAPGNVTVTINRMGNVYSYSAEKLWLAYGLAISIAIISVAIGLLAIFRSGASFTLNFSTIVRATRTADVSIEMDEQSLPGKDPLPKSWKRARFTIQPVAAYQVNNLKSGPYASVNQNDDRPPQAEDQLSPELRFDKRPGGNALERAEERRSPRPGAREDNE
ncbi:hypothetical protein CB0940_03962 [Cercospora beticola]|uniref:Uncharacterized protein n=1 Tax=Cercospora beticola TaxID=122368 RepID=A0A2G5HLV1_CERBT|nr:hypothetical protein CB0940_03962 [Cercospora beticola]PIA93527.1 hypothetical protein CB0940_03962 [Cercospora beticola]WPB01166.1 hypothetical protein RHO25_005787 [Cercospora beticola]